MPNFATYTHQHIHSRSNSECLNKHPLSYLVATKNVWLAHCYVLIENFLYSHPRPCTVCWMGVWSPYKPISFWQRLIHLCMHCIQ